MPADDLRALLAATKDINDGFQTNVPPIPVDDCTGGVYFLRNKSKRIAAVFKPCDEEPYAPNHPKQFRRLAPAKTPSSGTEALNSDLICRCQQPESECRTKSSQSGIRVGIAPGDAAVREVAAYLLDRDRSAGVPTSVVATAAHAAFHVAPGSAASSTLVLKTGALQLYIPHKCTAEDIASSLFSPADVHAIAVLDIRLANQDRHGGNLLVIEQAKRVFKLVPIDHGACLPRVSEMEETSFEWLFWPQAKRAFSDNTRAYIASLSSWDEARMLCLALPPDHQLEEQAVLTLHVCTALLQVCALEWNMSANDIGALMCRRENVALEQQQTEQSVLEVLVAKAQADAARWEHQPEMPNRAAQEQRFRATVDCFKRHLNAYLSDRAA
ncbi:hypothetical protein PybrP1_001849 [[Pythium] brassicae (nom. inval.)]|nr:hypothetical protein PybrP1_001849 [[Pythium] brassicae (nom. inval.)]